MTAADWSSLAADAQRGNTAGGGRCSVGRFLESLPADMVDFVDGVVMDPLLTGTSVARAIRDRIGGAAPSSHAVNRHRRRDCLCWKDDE